MQHQDPAVHLRAFVNALLLRGLVTPKLAEDALVSVKSLEDAAKAGQQLGALAQAATAPTSVVAPTLKTRPLTESTWQQHDHFSTEGRPIADEPAAVTRARCEAERMYGPRPLLRGETREVA